MTNETNRQHDNVIVEYNKISNEIDLAITERDKMTAKIDELLKRLDWLAFDMRRLF